MSGKTKIEWCDKTWSPVTGCSKVSEGCRNCWAERMSKRFKGTDGFKVTLHPDRLEEPLRWRKPSKIFVGSMTDIFHNNIPDEYIDRIFAVMASCQQHIFLILTKRPERMRYYLNNASRPFTIQKALDGVIVDLTTGPVNKEEWRAIPGYEDFYEVSNSGCVRRIGSGTKGRRNPEGILRPQATRGGYQKVCLSLGAQVRQVRINRLVLKAFIGPPPFPDAEARHRNGNRTDNRIENLLWGSKKDNMIDASRHGTAGVWAKSQAKFTVEQVTEIRTLRAKGLKLDDIAIRYNTTRKHISAICLGNKYRPPIISWPLPNAWLGVSIEDQKTADERIPLLLQTPAAKRFVSYEPAIRPVDFKPYIRIAWQCSYCRGYFPDPLKEICPSCNKKGGWTGSHAFNPPGGQRGSGLNWVIMGGESSPGARPMQIGWARNVAEQCVAAGIPLFYKQGPDDYGNAFVKMPFFMGKVWREKP